VILYSTHVVFQSPNDTQLVLLHYYTFCPLQGQRIPYWFYHSTWGNSMFQVSEVLDNIKVPLPMELIYFIRITDVDTCISSGPFGNNVNLCLAEKDHIFMIHFQHPMQNHSRRVLNTNQWILIILLITQVMWIIILCL